MKFKVSFETQSLTSHVVVNACNELAAIQAGHKTREFRDALGRMAQENLAINGLWSRGRGVGVSAEPAEEMECR